MKIQNADTVLRNAAVYTVDDQRSWAQAIAIKDQRIVYVGPNEGLEEYISPNTATA